MFLTPEDLWIVSLAEKLSDRINNFARSWNYELRKSIGDQISRAADSIGANIVEGCARQHNLETLKFLYIARASLQETRYWLRRSRARGLIKNQEAEDMDALYIRLAQGLSAFINRRRQK